MNKDNEAKVSAQEDCTNPSSNTTDDKEKRSNSPVDALIRLTSDMQLFHDQHSEAYIFHKGESIKLKSAKARRLLSYRLYERTGRTPSVEALTNAITTLEGIALFEKKMIKLENRVAKLDSGFLYDLGDSRAVKTTDSGWSIINAPPKFYRYQHQSVQVTPLKTKGDAFRIFNFINVSEENKLLVLVTLVSYFVPGIPHPIFHPWGSQGSGKTSLFRAFKKLVDPSIAETLMCSNDRSKVIHSLVKHYLPLFDNLSGINGEISDLLCQACTGGGIEQRKLYTDDDSIIFQILRCVGMNGINLSVIKPDLLDRTIILQLTRINSKQRRSEADLWNAFEESKPYILGGIFDLLSKAMTIYPHVKLDNLPRLADFGLWGYAIAEAIEEGKGQQFIDDYRMNIDRQVEEAIQSSTLAISIFSRMENSEEWETTIAGAFADLKRLTDSDTFDKSFPKAPRELRRYLERIKVTLEAKGIIYDIGKRDMYGTPIIFRKTAKFASYASCATSEEVPFLSGHEEHVANEPLLPNSGVAEPAWTANQYPF